MNDTIAILCIGAVLSLVLIVGFLAGIVCLFCGCKEGNCLGGITDNTSNMNCPACKRAQIATAGLLVGLFGFVFGVVGCIPGVIIGLSISGYVAMIKYPAP